MTAKQNSNRDKHQSEKFNAAFDFLDSDDISRIKDEMKKFLREQLFSKHPWLRECVKWLPGLLPPEYLGRPEPNLAHLISVVLCGLGNGSTIMVVMNPQLYWIIHIPITLLVCAWFIARLKGVGGTWTTSRFRI